MSERIPLTRHDAPRCKDCWNYIPMTVGKQGSINGRCKIRNSRTDQCGGRNQYNKACKQIKPIEPTTTVTVKMEVNKARMDEYLAILESMLYCGVIKSIKTLDEDLSKTPVLILKNDSVLFDIPFEKLKDLKGLEGEKVSCIEVYLKSEE